MFFKKKEKAVITVKDLEKNIKEFRVIPAPDYSKCKPYKSKITPVIDLHGSSYKKEDDEMDR